MIVPKPELSPVQLLGCQDPQQSRPQFAQLTRKQTTTRKKGLKMHRSSWIIIDPVHSTRTFWRCFGGLGGNGLDTPLHEGLQGLQWLTLGAPNTAAVSGVQPRSFLRSALVLDAAST